MDNQINNKFIESYDIDDYEILTDTGWQDAVKIHKTIKYKIWQIKTINYTLKCADEHIVFDENYNEVYIKDLKIHQKIITDSGPEEIIDIRIYDEEDNMYDIELDDSSSHRYYTNGILSHNTTTYTIFCLWYATLFLEKKIMICANKLATALEIMDRIKTAYDYLPDFIKPGVVVYNKGSIEFTNKSKITAFSTSSSGARGSSANCIVLDEFSFVPQNIASDFMASVMPIISSSKNSKAIIVSTPNGASGLYYDIWQQATDKNQEKNEQGWKPFRMRWWEAPGRDEKWKQQQIATIGQERWRQEFECEFLASTTQKLIPDDITEKYRMKISEYKVKGIMQGQTAQILSEAEDKMYDYTVWHVFNPNKTYLASADISEGGGGDYSVLYIWDISDLSEIKMCAKFASNRVSITAFAYITTKICALYNNPWFIAERNGVGSGMIDTLQQTYQYENIVFEGKNNLRGVFSHYQTKARACLWARDMVTTDGFGFDIYDSDLLDEWNIFVKKKSSSYNLSYAAALGGHDDLIMAFIWMCYVLQNEIIDKYYIVVNTFKDTLGNIHPKLVRPLSEATDSQISKISNDPTYIKLKQLEDEVRKKNKDYEEKYKSSEEADIFKYQLDPYFGDKDFSSWDNPAMQNSADLNSSNKRPIYFL